MLQRLVTFSLRFKGVVIVLACIVIGYGIHVVENAKLDVFPNFVQPQVVIQTECPGMAPEQVELLVTRPIETMVNGLGEMESLRSESIEGLSIITAVFKESTDVFRARQMLGEKLAETAGTLPLGAQTPRLTPLTSSTMDLLKIGLVSDKLTPMELRSFADWTLKPRLLSVPGVAKCSMFGGEVRQLQIQVIPDRLLAYNLSLNEVIAAARVATGITGAGFIETSNQRIVLQTEGQAYTPETLGETVITHTNGFGVRLKDVARVIEGAQPKFGDTVIMGRWGVLMTMSSQYGANTMDVTKALEAALREMRPVFEQEGIKVYDRLHRPATFIETALTNIRHSLGLGAILVAAVLFLLLGSFRAAFISLIAIPLSLLSAVILLDKVGLTLNTITIGGLAIALGEVVDDSIVDVENIFRRLRLFLSGSPATASSTPPPPASESAAPAVSPTPAPPAPAGRAHQVFDVVLNASLEVRRAVIYATFTVAMIFLPVLTLTGLQGSFFAPLALSYIFCILASLLVALTVTPALALLLVRKGLRKAAEPRLQTWLKAGYTRTLAAVSRHPNILLAFVAVVCIASALRVPFLGGEFLPDFRERHLVLQVFAAPGTSLPEMLRIGRQISLELLNNKNIDTVEQQVGRAELGEDPWGPHRSELHVELKPISGREEREVTEQIRELLGRFPGITFEVLTFLGDRIGETLTGETAPVVISIYGDDLDVLDAKAREVAAVLNTVPGHADVQVKAAPGSPRLVIRLRHDRLFQFGFRPVEVLDALQTAYQGTVVAQSYRANQVSDVAILLEPQSRQDPATIGALMLRNSGGTQIPLRELAELYETTGRPSILHEGGRRRQTVTCATSGRDVTSFVADARNQILAKVNFPAGTYPVFSGAAEARRRAENELLLNSGIAAVGILMLLAIAFRNWRNMLLVLANVPFALVGGVLAVWLTGALLGSNAGSLSLGSLVGFVTLFGITTRNSIMMISHFEHLVREEGLTWGHAAAMRGASERLMPILMTATVTGLALLPLALGSGEAGREIEGPMAVVILGGLFTSTILNLFVLPSLALRFGRFEVAE